MQLEWLDKQALRILLSPSPRTEITGADSHSQLLCFTRDLNSGIYVYTASNLPNMPSPQSSTFRNVAMSECGKSICSISGRSRQLAITSPNLWPQCLGCVCVSSVCVPVLLSWKLIMFLLGQVTCSDNNFKTFMSQAINHPVNHIHPCLSHETKALPI